MDTATLYGCSLAEHRLHERTLSLVYKDSALSFEELLLKDNSVYNPPQKLATDMYNDVNNPSPPRKLSFHYQRTPINEEI